MINQVKERTQANFPIVSLESGGMIGVTSAHLAANTASQPPQSNLTASIVCLGLGALLGAVGASMLISSEIAKVQADAKIQISKAQDTAAIAQWNSLKKQEQIDEFCSKNGSQKNGKNN
jgi:cell division protein FtsB